MRRTDQRALGGGGKADSGSLALLDGAFVTPEVAGICAVLWFRLGFGHAPPWARLLGALSSWRCIRGRRRQLFGLGWSPSTQSDSFPSALAWVSGSPRQAGPWPQSHGRGLACSGLCPVWPRSLWGWLCRRLGRGHRQRHPLPSQGREGPPYLFPLLLSFQIFIHLS